MARQQVGCSNCSGRQSFISWSPLGSSERVNWQNVPLYRDRWQPPTTGRAVPVMACRWSWSW